jgi:hypothetical protein
MDGVVKLRDFTRGTVPGGCKKRELTPGGAGSAR